MIAAAHNCKVKCGRSVGVAILLLENESVDEHWSSAGKTLILIQCPSIACVLTLTSGAALAEAWLIIINPKGYIYYTRMRPSLEQDESENMDARKVLQSSNVQRS